MRMRMAATVAVLAIPMILGGCFGRLGGEGEGAQGRASVIQAVSEDPKSKTLGAYQHFELAPLIDSTQGLCPPDFVRNLGDPFARQLKDARIPDLGSGKTLLIRGVILHYEVANMSTDQAFGPYEEVLARVELVDRDSGRVIGIANCVGRTKTTTGMGMQKKTEGLAKAIVGWIEQNYPDSAKTPKKGVLGGRQTEE